MRLRLIFALIVCVLLGASSSFAQNFTSVSGTIVDPNGLPYSNCNITAELVPAGTNPTIGGAAIGGLNRANCDVNGTFSMTLGSNAVIVPGATQWKFTVNEQPGISPPEGFGPQSFVVTLTISGASQSISTQLNAAALALGRLAGSAVAPGGAGAVPFNNGLNLFAADSNLSWDNTNKTLNVNGAGTAAVNAANNVGISVPARSSVVTPNGKTFGIFLDSQAGQSNTENFEMYMSNLQPNGGGGGLGAGLAYGIFDAGARSLFGNDFTILGRCFGCNYVTNNVPQFYTFGQFTSTPLASFSNKWSLQEGTLTVTNYEVTGPGSPNNQAFINTPSVAADQYASLRMVAVRAAGDVAGVLLRASGTAGASQGYICEINGGGSPTWAIIKDTAGGTHATLGSGSLGFVVGGDDHLYCEIRGTTISLYFDVIQNGMNTSVLVGTVSDASFATGQPGIYLVSGTTAAAGGLAWDGGNLDDTFGTIQITAAVSASHTFNVAYQVAPFCEVFALGDPNATGAPWATTSTTAVTANVHTSGTLTVGYKCQGKPF